MKTTKIDDNFEDFYFTQGVNLANITCSDVKKGIKYLWTCFEMELKRGVISDETLGQLALAYSNAFNFEMSNTLFYIALNYFYKPSYVVHIAQNDMLSNNFEHGLELLKSILKDSSVSNYTQDFAKKTFDNIKTFPEEYYKSIKEDEYGEKVEQKITEAQNCMSVGDFERAVEIYKSLNLYDDDDVRAELTLAYFFMGRYSQAEQVVKKYGKNSTRDLSNLLLIYDAKKDKKSYDLILEKIKNLDLEDERESFNIGLSLAQTGQPELAIEFMEDYVKIGYDEAQVNFYYTLACINAKKYDKAKDELLVLRDYDVFNRYMYDYYLSLCNNKTQGTVEYLYSVPVKEYIKINKQVDDLIKLDEKKLEKYFHENFFFFFYLAKNQNIDKINHLLYKLAKIDSAYASFYFNFINVTDFVSYETKKNLILLRASVNKVKFKGVTVKNLVIPQKNDEISKLFENNFDEHNVYTDKVIDFASAKKQLTNSACEIKPFPRPADQVTGKQFVSRQNQMETTQRGGKTSTISLENCIGFVHDDKYFRFCMPNMEKLFVANPLLHDATLFAFAYLVDNVQVAGEYDLSPIVVPLLKAIKGDTVNKFAVSTYIAWKVFNNKKRSLSKIINHFNLDPQVFYDFLDKYSLNLE